MTPLIVVENLARVFEGPPEVYALRDCSFEVVEGEMVAIMGPSGSGKSTLLNCLGLLDRQTAGRYLLDGSDVTRIGERRRAGLRARIFGFVFQDYHLLAGRTALENAALGSLYQRTAPKARIAEARRCLEEVGLAARCDALVETLSGGERQRVAIARSLVGAPRLLLCDEPTGNLDSDTGGTVLDILEHLTRRGQTIIIVTHDPNVAARAHRQFRMCDGTLSEIV